MPFASVLMKPASSWQVTATAVLLKICSVFLHCSAMPGFMSLPPSLRSLSSDCYWGSFGSSDHTATFKGTCEFHKDAAPWLPVTLKAGKTRPLVRALSFIDPDVLLKKETQSRAHGKLFPIPWAWHASSLMVLFYLCNWEWETQLCCPCLCKISYK